MGAVQVSLHLTPENENDEIVVSKKGLAELRRIAEQAEARERENERLRKEVAELRRRPHVHENPNVPTSVRNQAPGHSRARALTPVGARKKPGVKPGHPGSTRENPSPDETRVYTAPDAEAARALA